MNYERSKDIAELLGILCIVASLIFVGLQLKQSQDIALAGQYHARAAATQDLYLAQLESGFDYSKWFRPAAELSDSESNANFAVFSWSWTHMENMHFQHEAGFLSEETWDGFERAIVGSKSSDVARQSFEARRVVMRRSFAELVDQLWRSAGD